MSFRHIPALAGPLYGRGVASIRRVFRASEGAVILLAVGIGAAAGLLTLLQNRVAHGVQALIYGLSGASLSAAATIAPARLLALPLGGLLLMMGAKTIARRRAPIDVVEANALHGGAIPIADTLIVCVQTLVSNGCGASVGLEAAYAQAAGGLASVVGRVLRLRRADLRVLVGAGAGAAIGAAFGAPLTGAFYAFEIVIGAYTPAAIAPVAAACVCAVLLTRALGLEAYVVALPGAKAITTGDYLLYAVLALACAGIGIGVMRAVTWIEAHVRRSRLREGWRAPVGGFFLIPLALITPQALSAGHGALHLDLGAEVALHFLVLVLVIKIAASAISLGFGFRGGLFFASLFIGSLAGQIFAAAIIHVPGAPVVDPSDAALIGMAAMGVAIIGAPMTMSMLVLETTHDFTLTSVAVVAALCAGTAVREIFGFSFSTWRMHTRGQTVRSARDIGWVHALTVDKMMQRAPAIAAAQLTIGEFREAFPLGSTNRVVLKDGEGRYAGMVETSTAFAPDVEMSASVGTLGTMPEFALRPSQDVREALAVFDASEADYLAVVNSLGAIVGILSEKFLHRRYTDEVEKAQREMFGE